MPRLRWNERWKLWSVLAILTAFVATGLVQYWDAQGDDLASSYVGCRLMAAGNTSHLYTYDPNDFAGVGDDDAWQAAADWGGFDSYLHPYVQTPLWAYLLQPLAGLKFAPFERLFAALALLSFAGCVWLVARYWTPALSAPYAIAAVLLCLWYSEPFVYAMTLVQTHILFLLLTVAALILAERERPGWAGLLLACAAAVKVTPVVLVLYWLVTRRWKAAVSTLLWSAALAAVTVAAVGWHLVQVYLADISRISHLLLVAFNNQSLAAWWMGRFYPGELNEFHMLPLPPAVRLTCLALMAILTIAGGLIDRQRSAQSACETGKIMPPLGAMIALIAGTVCAPIAWTHYSILLVVPVMVLWQEAWTTSQWWVMGAMVPVIALNFLPLAMDVVLQVEADSTILRSEFYAETLCVAILGVVAWTSLRRRLRNKVTEVLEPPLALHVQ